MANLLQHRKEIRGQVQFDPEHPPINLNAFEAEKFEKQVSNTLYLGFPGGRFPEGFAFRIRFYNDQVPANGVSVLDLDQQCFLELKYKIDGQDGTRKKIRHLTTVREAIQTAKSLELVLAAFDDDLEDHMRQTLTEFYKQDGVCQPLSSVAYLRNHYVGKKQEQGNRLTLDTNIASVPIVQYDGVWFLGQPQIYPNGVVEFKKQTAGEIAEANISKFRLSTESVEQAVHIEPGMNMKAEGDWVLSEQELKMNTISDPRPTLHDLEGTDDIILGPSKEGSSMMQFVIIGDNGICIMGRENVTPKMAIKFKENVAVKGGVIIKNETVQPYKVEALKEIVEGLGGSLEAVERTAYFVRNRAIRLVVCKNTGNIFAITADKCVAEDDRPDLNQVEVEYRGKIANSGIQEVDQIEVDEDFKKVSGWLYIQLRRKRQLPEFTLQTKFEWASAPIENQSLPEQFGQGNNARIEIKDGKVKKSYDLWGAAAPAEVIKDEFDRFHAQVAAIYTVPRLEGTLIEGHSLVIKEEMIVGQMGSKFLATANDDQIAGFIFQCLSPLSGQIEQTQYDLGDDNVSTLPLAVPIDLKPDNFIINDQNEAIFVDMFPPLTRTQNGGLFETYPIKSGKHEAWVYGEASVLITRFLMRCLQDRPEKTELITISVLAMVDQIDPSGALLEQLKINADRAKTISDFEKRIPSFGLIALSIIRSV